MKTMEVNGIVFEVTQARKYESSRILFIKKSTGQGLSYFYNRPSETKKEIYNEWERWAYETKGCEYFGITGANCMTFSIGFLLEYDEHYYIGIVTKAHNKLIKVI